MEGVQVAGPPLPLAEVLLRMKLMGGAAFSNTAASCVANWSAEQASAELV
jgi:hypothetical protein